MKAKVLNALSAYLDPIKILIMIFITVRMQIKIHIFAICFIVPVLVEVCSLSEFSCFSFVLCSLCDVFKII